jgi:phenylacetate-CoA ligase
MTDLFAPMVRHLIYPLSVAKNGSPELRYLRALRRSQYYSPAQIEELRWARLKTILAHAFSTIPFYHRRFIDAGFHPRDIHHPSDLVRLPPLTKDDIQRHQDELISREAFRPQLIADRTGGSTGAPLEFYYDRDRLASRQAATIRHNEWAGWRVGDKVAILWAASRDVPKALTWRQRIRRGLLSRTIVLDAAGMSEATLERFTKLLLSYRPHVLLAYANTMTLYARYVRDQGISIIRPASIVCSAEVLHEKDRAFIETTFGCPVFNRYGCREFSVIASECPTHAGLHVNAENLFVEFVRNGRHVREGLGEILITDLANRAMPLIRYQIGDVGTPLPEHCACGRGLQKMLMHEGRSTDFILTPSGLAVSGVALATYVIPTIPGLRKAQFVQNSRNHVTIKIVTDPHHVSATAERLSKKVREFVGSEISIDVSVVADIPEEPSGKFRFIKSSVPVNDILAGLRTGKQHGDARQKPTA